MAILDLWSRPTVRQYAIGITVNLSVLAVGLGVAWSSPVLVKLSNSTTTVLDHPITQEEGSLIVSSPILLGLVVNLVTFYLVDKLGRKACFLGIIVPRIVGWIILVMATKVWMLIVGRMLAGAADAATFTVVPMYSSEIASNEVRGGLGTILQIAASIGIVTILSIGPFLDYVTLNCVILGISIAASIPLLFLPDSPYFLFKCGKKEEAIKVLTFLKGSESAAHEEIKEYEALTDDGITIKEILHSKTVLKALGIVIVIGAGSQLTGYNGVAFYLQTILESTNTSIKPEIASVVIGLIQMIASVCTTLTTDKFGRKPIITTSLVGMAVGLVGLGTFFKLKEVGYETVGFLNFLPLMSLVIVVFCFSGGLGALVWPLMAEMFDGRARAFGVSISLFFNILSLYLVSRFFAPLISTIGAAATYWIFAVNTLILMVFVLFCVPETKGKSFAEIQKSL